MHVNMYVKFWFKLYVTMANIFYHDFWSKLLLFVDNEKVLTYCMYNVGFILAIRIV